MDECSLLSRLSRCNLPTAARLLHGFVSVSQMLLGDAASHVENFSSDTVTFTAGPGLSVSWLRPVFTAVITHLTPKRHFFGWVAC